MRWLVSLVALLLLAGCNPAADAKASEEAVAAFHDKMSAGQYAAIYDGSAGDMKSATKREEFVKFAAALTAKLGSFKSGKTVGWHVNATTGGTIITLNRQAQFEKGAGTEQFVFRIENGRAILAGLLSPESPSAIVSSVARLLITGVGLWMIYRGLR